MANDVSAPGVGFGVDTNQVTLLTPGGEGQAFRGSKREVAAALWERLAKLEVGTSR